MTDERKKINVAFLVLHMKTKTFISEEGYSLLVSINPFSISLVQNYFQQIPDQILIITIMVLSQYHSLRITSNFLNYLNETKLEVYLLWIWQSYNTWTQSMGSCCQLSNPMRECLFIYVHLYFPLPDHQVTSKLQQQVLRYSKWIDTLQINEIYFFHHVSFLCHHSIFKHLHTILKEKRKIFTGASRKCLAGKK